MGVLRGKVDSVAVTRLRQILGLAGDGLVAIVGSSDAHHLPEVADAAVIRVELTMDSLHRRLDAVVGIAEAIDRLAIGPRVDPVCRDSSALLAGRQLLGRIRSAARPRPLVIVVNGAPWLDPASVDVLRFVLRRLRPAEATVVFLGSPPAVLGDEVASYVASTLPLPGGSERLTADQQRTLDVVAVLGSPAAIAEVERVLIRLDGPAAEPAFSELVSREDAGTAGTDGWARITGLGIVEQVRAALPVGRRRSIHAAAAAETTGRAALAHRVAASTGSDPALAAHLRAASALAQQEGQTADAAQLGLWASRLDPAPSDRTPQDAARRVASARVMDAAALLDTTSSPAVVAELESILTLLPESPQRTFLAATLALSRRRLDEADRLLERILSGSRDPGPGMYGDASKLQAEIRAITGDHGGLLSTCERAQRRVPGDLRTLPNHAYALWINGRESEGMTMLHRLPDSVQHPAFYSEALTIRATLELYSGDLQRAQATLADARRYESEAGATFSLVGTLTLQALLEFHFGHWDDSELHARLALDFALEQRLDRQVPGIRAILALVPAARGEIEIAEQQLRRASDVAAREPASLETRSLLLFARIILARARNRPEDVLETLQVVRSVTGFAGGFVDDVFRQAGVAALIALDRISEAEEALRSMETSASPERSRADLVAAPGLLEAQVAEARGETQTAVAAYERALAHRHLTPVPLSRALLALAAGRFFRGAGRDPVLGADLLEQATEQLVRLRVRPGTYDAPMSHLDDQAPSETTAALAKLTRREQEIALLVARGHTSTEVAGALFISVRTVDHHVGNVLRKLSLSTRRKLRFLLDG